MIIHRNYNRTEHDDFVLNVEKHLTENKVATPLYYEEKVVAWKIHDKYE